MRLTEIRTDPRPVAIARIGVGIATILNSIEAYQILSGVASGGLTAPVAGILTPSLAALLPVVVVALVAAVAVTIGWHTEWAATVSVVVSVTFFFWDQQIYSSHRLLATLLMAYMIFAKAGTAWSVRPAPGRPPVVWWPQLLMMTQLSVCYLFSALSKMNVVFLSGAPLSTWVWVDLPWQFYTVAALCTVAVELVIAFGLWFRSSRRVAVLLGLGLHLSIVVLMKADTVVLFAFALTCVSLYPLFIFRPALRFPWMADPEPTSEGRSPATTA
ncbi:vitamin K-dependent gamma-carboxylase-like protein [Agromyces ramosus]|uniref:Vitamin K-dependent gamma-carboxylase-like protein n=1 Tax=Agromyces ramosus TaxID=33879 RepID=A0A4V2F037_9MICO|nr:HTTM domain-containing protein [Agromyces ramosus]RZS68630.1 vitamin K-dependent gamma-carboxylase-like protein [Agromyces ramosus]